MNRTPRTIRRAGAIAGAVVCLAVWPPASVEPQAADPVAQAGQVLAAGRVDEAIAMFEKAVAADPNDPAALAWLGSAQVRRGETFLEIRDAGTMDFQARVWTGQHFPLGFHGNFYAA